VTAVIDKRVITLTALLVVLDALSTYLCTLYYPLELEFNPLLRYLLKTYGEVSLVMYAPLEFTALILLLSAYSKLLVRIGVKDTFKYCVVVIVALLMFIALNFIGVLVKLV
jgi:hypothetical protein